MKRAPMLVVAAALVPPGCYFAAADPTTAPDHPTFETDVLPVLADHCNLCHGDPASRGAPDSFRLDLFDGAGGKAGAGSMAGDIADAVRNDEMPPAAAWGDGLGPNAKKIIERWVADGAPR